MLMKLLHFMEQVIKKMIRYVGLLARKFSNLFLGNIEECINNFAIDIKSLDSNEFINLIEKNNLKKKFNKEDEISFIHNNKGKFTIYYNGNKLKYDSVEWNFVMAHEFAHFLFWHIHKQTHNIDPYNIPIVLGINLEIINAHDSIKNFMIMSEDDYSYEPILFDEELIANFFAINFCIYKIKLYIKDYNYSDIYEPKWTDAESFELFEDEELREQLNNFSRLIDTVNYSVEDNCEEWHHSTNMIREDVLLYLKKINLDYLINLKRFKALSYSEVFKRQHHNPLNENIKKIIKKIDKKLRKSDFYSIIAYVDTTNIDEALSKLVELEKIKKTSNGYYYILEK